MWVQWSRHEKRTLYLFAYLERSAESRTWWYIQSTKVRRDNTQHTSTRGSIFVPVFLYTQARLTFVPTFQDLRRTPNSATLADPAFHQQRKGRSDWPHKRSLTAEAHGSVFTSNDCNRKRNVIPLPTTHTHILKRLRHKEEYCCHLESTRVPRVNTLLHVFNE